MRAKAAVALKSRTRRKQQQPQQPPEKNGISGGSSSGNGSQQQSDGYATSGGGPQHRPLQPQQHHEQARRQPTAEEAALTAKNYRLAKELSDLRVRHRDETKTVTRLTMENMNLASRCREAISHVAMLKKELALHQRRAAEALALQRQQATRSSGTPLGAAAVSVGSPVASMGVNMDQLLLQERRNSTIQATENRQVQAQFHTSKAMTAMLMKTSEFDGAPVLPNRLAAVPGIVSVAEDDDEDEEEDMIVDVDDEVAPLASGAVFRPVPTDEKNTDGNSESASRSSSDRGGSGVLALRATRPNGVKPGMELEERPPSPVFNASPLMKQRKAVTTSSSIDAFEASFDTTFPASFASAPRNEKRPSLDIAFDVPEFSDPFFLGSLEGSTADPPALNGAQSEPGFQRKDSGDSGSAKEMSASSPKHGRSPDASTRVNGGIGASSSPAMLASSGNIGIQPRHFFPGEDGTPDRSSESSGTVTRRDVTVRSPPSAQSSPGASYQSPSKSASPRRLPSARSILQGTGAPSAEGNRQDKSHKPGVVSKAESDHSPSLVLRRLQQRRAKEKAAASGVGAGASPSSREASGNASKSPVDSRARTFSADDSKRQERRAAMEYSGFPDDESQASVDGKADELKKVSIGKEDGAGKTERNAPEGDVTKRVAQQEKPVTEPTPSSSRHRHPIESTRTRPIPETERNSFSASLQDATTEESRKDETDTQSSETGVVLKRYRAVKQPVSYAEPSLHSKLRRGDVFFPKKDSGSNVFPSEPAKPDDTTPETGARIVSPASEQTSAMEGVNDPPRDETNDFDDELEISTIDGGYILNHEEISARSEA